MPFHSQTISRRDFVRITAASLAATSLLSCERSPSANRIVCYCSMDADVAQPIFDAFTAATGIRVDAVFDTEATKTTGLVNRLLGEKARPRADVWWASEPFGSIRLQRASVLAKVTMTPDNPPAAGWPAALRGKEQTWLGHALRRRVCVFNTTLAPALATRPNNTVDITELASLVPTNRLALARPQFGTTRGHVAILLATHGEAAFAAWLTALKTANIRLVDGNAAVVRSVANGSAHAGFADVDDVEAGKLNGWPIASCTLRNDLGHPNTLGEIYLPCTAALVQGAPNPTAGMSLLKTILSAKVDEELASSSFHTRPARTADDALLPNLDAAADAMDRAMTLCDQILGS